MRMGPDARAAWQRCRVHENAREHLHLRDAARRLKLFRSMNEITRLRFLKLLLAGAAFSPGLSMLGSRLDDLRGERVGWARLKTPSPHWKRHSGSDPVLMKFFR